MSNYELEKVFEECDEQKYQEYIKCEFCYSDIVSVFDKVLNIVTDDRLFKLVKFFGWNSNDELLDYYFKNIQSKEYLENLINKADELINYMNKNPQKFTYSVDCERVSLFQADWKKADRVFIAWEQMHLFQPAENILSILLRPIYKLDFVLFVNLWQKIEWPFYAAHILRECEVSVTDVAKLLSETDIMVENMKWNKKFSAALLLEYSFTKMFYPLKKYFLESENNIKQYVKDNYTRLIEILCGRDDANFILKEWFVYIAKRWVWHFPEYKKNIPIIVSQIVKLIQQNGKNIDIVMDLENANDKDIQSLLLVKIYSHDGCDFDQKYLDFLFKSYENKQNVVVYSVPKVGYLRDDISYLGQLLVGVEKPVEVWQNKWKSLELFRMQCRHNLNNYDMLNSSLFHILFGLSAFNYLINKDRNTAISLLDTIWDALKELYFLNGYINFLHVETFMLYVVCILMEEKIQDKCIEKIKFISSNLQFFIRLINQKKYTHRFLEWFDNELKQKIKICYQIANLYKGQKNQYIIFNDELVQTLKLKDE